MSSELYTLFKTLRAQLTNLRQEEKLDDLRHDVLFSLKNWNRVIDWLIEASYDTEQGEMEPLDLRDYVRRVIAEDPKKMLVKWANLDPDQEQEACELQLVERLASHPRLLFVFAHTLFKSPLASRFALKAPPARTNLSVRYELDDILLNFRCDTRERIENAVTMLKTIPECTGDIKETEFKRELQSLVTVRPNYLEAHGDLYEWLGSRGCYALVQYLKNKQTITFEEPVHTMLGKLATLWDCREEYHLKMMPPKAFVAYIEAHLSLFQDAKVFSERNWVVTLEPEPALVAPNLGILLTDKRLMYTFAAFLHKRHRSSEAPVAKNNNSTGVPVIDFEKDKWDILVQKLRVLWLDLDGQLNYLYRGEMLMDDDGFTKYAILHQKHNKSFARFMEENFRGNLQTLSDFMRATPELRYAFAQCLYLQRPASMKNLTQPINFC